MSLRTYILETCFVCKGEGVIDIESSVERTPETEHFVLQDAEFCPFCNGAGEFRIFTDWKERNNKK